MIIVLFNSVRTVIKAEKIIRNGNLTCQVRPVPTSITSECGMCLEIDSNEKNRVAEYLTTNNIEFRLHELTDLQ